jgi:hypothetical protein
MVKAETRSLPPITLLRVCINRNDAKTGGIQSQGAKGAAVALCCNPLAAPELESGFPVRVKI